MYTRCPSCRAEISFEPPVHADSLPDGYKHKIKCPSCGVTIGVKIPRHEVAIQPTYVPQNPNAVSPEETYEAPLVADNNVAEDVAPAKAKKKGFGRAASAFAMIWSLLLTAALVLGYLVNTEIIKVDFLLGLAMFDPISPVMLLIEDAARFDAVGWIISLIPTVALLFAFIQFVVSFSCLCAGKYSKAYNTIWCLILFLATAACLFQLSFAYFYNPSGLSLTTEEALMLPIDLINEAQVWIAYAVPGLGFVAFLTALCSLGVKNPNKQPKIK